jgi:hypothetical protein
VADCGEGHCQFRRSGLKAHVPSRRLEGAQCGMHWREDEPPPPTWRTWAVAMRAAGVSINEPQEADGLPFPEELHAIEAAIGGQGVAICSDVLVAHEL